MILVSIVSGSRDAFLWLVDFELFLDLIDIGANLVDLSNNNICLEWSSWIDYILCLYSLSW